MTFNALSDNMLNIYDIYIGGFEMAKKTSTPEYTKKAIQRYNEKFDRVAVNLPKGTKEKIKELTGLSCNRYISELVIENIRLLEEKKIE